MTTILFDLDGTIINSFLGITRCVQYALRSKGIYVENLEDLEEYIGPPLKQTFQKNYDFSDEETIDLIQKYRERFDVTGIFENELYPGVEQTLLHLKERGYPLVLASSKPETACERILEKHGLLSCFDEVVGATLDGRISTKEQVLKEVFRRIGSNDPKDYVLIGDTIYDVEGANKVGMDCIGVSYGFGKAEDLEHAGAVSICRDLEEVERVVVERY